MASDATRPGGSHRAGSFHELGDEFAGDAANEEWDAAWAAYASGADTASGAGDAPLRGVLRLPSGRVELRGEIDDQIVSLLVDLHDDHDPDEGDLGVGVVTRSVTFTVRTTDATNWRLEQNDVGAVAQGDGMDQLAAELLARIVPASACADDTQLHLDAACVELDGLGVVIVGGTSADRTRLVHALAMSGAAYLTSDDLVLRPGTRAVGGSPMPLADASGLPVAASAVAPVLDHASVDVIVFLGGERHADTSDTSGGSDTSDTSVGSDMPARRDTPLPATAPGTADGDRAMLPSRHGTHGAESHPIRQLPTLDVAAPDAVVRLLGSVRDIGDDTKTVAGAAVELLALFVAGATCVELATSDPLSQIASIRPLRPPERRQLVARFDWEETVADAVRSGARKNRRAATQRSTTSRMVRFDSGAVVVDQQGPRLVSAVEADEIEALVASRLRSQPGPEAFGLPNCPTGATARKMWESASIGQESTGVAAELMGHELVPAGDAERSDVIDLHIEARRSTEEAIEVLVEVLDAAASVGIEPVVVGSIVQAFDGPLPEHFTDVDRIDLLVRKEQLDLLVEQLEQRGYLLDSRTRSGSALLTTSDVRLRHPQRLSFVIDLHRTLAVGPFGELVDPEEFHQRAAPFRINGRRALALHPQHRFVHECVRAENRDTGTGTASTASTTELRDVVLSAPRVESLMADMMECSARWGATTTVLAAVRDANARLPGLPSWLVGRAQRTASSSLLRRRWPGRS